MTPQKTIIVSTGVLLLAFVVFGLYTWVRVVQVIPYSTNCATTLIQISQQSATIRPYFISAFVITLVAFEFSRPALPKRLRYAYLITLGLGAALLVVPWLIKLTFS